VTLIIAEIISPVSAAGLGEVLSRLHSRAPRAAAQREKTDWNQIRFAIGLRDATQERMQAWPARRTANQPSLLAFKSESSGGAYDDDDMIRTRVRGRRRSGKPAAQIRSKSSRVEGYRIREGKDRTDGSQGGGDPIGFESSRAWGASRPRG
jgi:hypothetical protein